MRNMLPFKPPKALLALLIIQILLNENIKAQLPDVPKMWISKRISKERIALFGIKKEILGSSHPSKYFFTKLSIENLINKIKSNYSSSAERGIRVYIGAPTVDLGSSSPVGSVQSNQLVLIFAPTETKKDIGKYYTVNKDDFSIREIYESTKEKWTENYVNKIIGDKNSGLASTIEDSPENYVDDKLSDTRSIYYLFDNFIEFMLTERDYQNSHSSDKINGFYFYFAAYNSSGIGCNAHREDEDKYKYRLLLIVEFTKKKNGKNGIFYIDDLDDFEKRKKPDCPNGGKAVTGADNGQLCPLNCPESR